MYHNFGEEGLKKKRNEKGKRKCFCRLGLTRALALQDFLAFKNQPVRIIKERWALLAAIPGFFGRILMITYLIRNFTNGGVKQSSKWVPLVHNFRWCSKEKQDFDYIYVIRAIDLKCNNLCIDLEVAICYIRITWKILIISYVKCLLVINWI